MKVFGTQRPPLIGLRRFATAATISLMMTGAAMAETLADALTSAYGHSGLLDQNRAVLRAADEDVAIAVASLRPTLTWAAEIERSFGAQKRGLVTANFASTESTLALIASYTLYDFGRGALGIEVAKETVLATREALVGIEQQVLFDAVSAFLDVRRYLEIVSLRENNLRVLQQELRAAQDRFEVGEVTRTDVALAEAQLAAARAALAASQGDLAIAQSEYVRVVGRKPGNLTPPKSLPRLPSLAEGQATALRLHPSLREAQHMVRVADLRLDSSKLAVKPTVSLNGRLAAVDDLGNGDYTRSGSVTLGAGGPIYQGGQLAAQTRKAQAGRDAQRGNLHSIRHAVTQNVSQSYATLQVATASIEANERQVRAATVAFRGVREEASLGSRTTFDVLQAEQDLLDAQAGLITATIDRQLASYRVLASLGMLTTEHLNLNVMRFDPAAYYNLVKSAPTATSKQGKQLDRVLEALGKE